ncbi:Transmembrane protein 19 [Blyttiomyces sp. JEL0837]|nr:Transmembrane protein 19 [Blyttiomyces sp. JEL0837]
MHILLALIACLGLAYHGLSKKSLSLSGAIAASIIGLLTFTHPSYIFTSGLLTFYLSSSFLTKLGKKRKASIEEGSGSGGSSGSGNGVSGFLEGGQVDDLNLVLVAAFIGHYACCNGDTWASELGVLAKGSPRLITNLFKIVPPGTNGGVTIVGLIASAMGGALIGVVAGLTMPSNCWNMDTFWMMVMLGLVSGLVGSLIDSLLGATLQRSTYNKKEGKIAPDFRRKKNGEEEGDLIIISGVEILDNHQVNYISSLLTATLAGCFAYVFL